MSPQYYPGQKVTLIILRETELGFVAQIDYVDEGLLYNNQIFEELKPGQEIVGYIAKVRDDGQIDLILQPMGMAGSKDLGQIILQELKSNNGFLAINAQTPAETIYRLFGVSKKKFKVALGGIYKKRLVVISDKGIELVAAKKPI